MTTGQVRTVLGDVEPSELGRIDYHEHLFQVSPLLPGDELDDEEAALEEGASLRASGFEGYVDATPSGLGRRPTALARVAVQTGLSIVMTTGLHRAEHYRPDDPRVAAGVEELAARFEADLVAGVVEDDAWDPGTRPRSEVRAGALKCAAGYWSLDDLARRVVEAVGMAHTATGAPVTVHLEHGSAAHEVLDLLGRAGVRADRVALAHVDRNPDPGLHSELAARGAYLGYDGAARHREWPDSVLLRCLSDVAAAGGGERLLLGGDVARRSRYQAYGGMPGLAYLGRRFVPRLADALGEEVLGLVLRTNPARWLTWS